MKKSGSNKKVANSLVAVSCGAVLAVYTAGYARTRAAADRLDAQTVERRAAAPDVLRPAIAPEERRSAITPAEVASGGAVSPAPAREAARRFNPDAAAVPVQATIETPAPSLSEPPALATPSQAAALAPAASAPVLAAPIPEAKVEAIVAPPPAASKPPATPKWKDGTYYGWGTSRHGDIQAQVVVEGGRIAAATISQCRTRYPCSVIEPLPPEVAQRQSPEVDYISRATQSTNAFYYAVVEALNKAK